MTSWLFSISPIDDECLVQSFKFLCGQDEDFFECFKFGSVLKSSLIYIIQNQLYGQ